MERYFEVKRHSKGILVMYKSKIVYNQDAENVTCFGPCFIAERNGKVEFYSLAKASFFSDDRTTYFLPCIKIFDDGEDFRCFNVGREGLVMFKREGKWMPIDLYSFTYNIRDEDTLLWRKKELLRLEGSGRPEVEKKQSDNGIILYFDGCNYKLGYKNTHEYSCVCPYFVKEET